jgi:hypothetical protein
LTHAGKFGALIEDVVRASRTDERSAPASRAADFPTGPAPNGDAFVDPRCASLLSRIMAEPFQNATAGETPCAQFVATDRAAAATAIAFGTAQAAASLLGRALLLDARLDHDAQTRPSAAQSASNAAHGQAAGTPIPDAFVPRLYHRALSHRSADAAMLFGQSRRDVLRALAAPFRLVIIDAPSPACGPAATALAPFCQCSILVVGAGQSSRAAVRETASRIADAGGRVIGTVLAGAPAGLPAWVGA